jgi:hypothetical protein
MDIIVSVFYQIRKTLLSINELSDFAIILNLSIRTGNGTLDSITTRPLLFITVAFTDPLPIPFPLTNTPTLPNPPINVELEFSNCKF